MGNQQRRRKKSRLRILVAVLVLLAAVVATVLLLFRIRNAEVSGNDRYSAEQIRSDLIYDYFTGNSLWLSWKYRNAISEPRTPYLNSVQVKLKDPSSVRILVQEKTLTGRVQYSGNNVYFDIDGVVMEISDQLYADVPLVTGVTMEEPALYQKLPVTTAATLRTMLSICDLLNRSDLLVDSVSFDENSNITVYIGTVRVQLGQDEYLEEKVANLESIYPKVEKQTGELNMTAFTGKNEAITFSEDVPEEYTGNVEAGQEVGIDDLGSEDAGTGEEGREQSEDTSGTEENAEEEKEQVGLDAFMVFDSYGTLRYDAHVVGGEVVDAYGSPIPGCSVNEDGNVVDAYWNVIDPMTGTLAQ